MTSKRFRPRGRAAEALGTTDAWPQWNRAAVWRSLSFCRSETEWPAMVAAHGAGGPPLHSFVRSIMTIQKVCCGVEEMQKPGSQIGDGPEAEMMLRMRMGQLRCQAHEYYVSTIAVSGFQPSRNYGLQKDHVHSSYNLSF